MSLIIATWKWGNKYSDAYLERLALGLHRHVSQPFYFRLFSPGPEDIHLTHIPGCFARLRMFSTAWQESMGIKRGDRLVCLDLDVVITRRLDMLFDRPEELVILGGANAANPCPYNGSVMMLRAGKNDDVWSEFSLKRASEMNKYEFPDDQGWIWHICGDNLPTWKCGPESGVYAYKKPGWPPGDDLPSDAKLVVFPGKRDPSQFTHLKWVQQHWSS